MGLSYGDFAVGEDVNYMENEELENEWVRLDSLVKIQTKNLGNQQHVDKNEEKMWNDKWGFSTFQNQIL